jgi:hypothetical protein
MIHYLLFLRIPAIIAVFSSHQTSRAVIMQDTNMITEKRRFVKFYICAGSVYGKPISVQSGLDNKIQIL